MYQVLAFAAHRHLPNNNPVAAVSPVSQQFFLGSLRELVIFLLLVLTMMADLSVTSPVTPQMFGAVHLEAFLGQFM